MPAKNFVKAWIDSTQETLRGSGIYRLHLNLADFQESDFQAGQFIALRPLNSRAIIRPFSIAWTDRSGIYLYIRAVGDENSNSSLYSHSQGKTLEISSAAGQPFELLPGVDNYILVAGGTGVAGLLLILQKTSILLLGLDLINYYL